MTVFYPSGAATGAASVTFEGDAEHQRMAGIATFEADPTKCTAITVPVNVTQSDLPDASP